MFTDAPPYHSSSQRLSPSLPIHKLSDTKIDVGEGRLVDRGANRDQLVECCDSVDMYAPQCRGVVVAQLD